MTVLFYCSKFPPLAGGAGTNAHYMAKYLSERGHRVLIVCEHASGLKKFEQINDNYLVHRVQIPFLKNRGSGIYFLLLCLGIAIKGIRLSWREKPDLLHLFDAATGIAGLITRLFVWKPSLYLFGGSIVYEYMCNAYRGNGWDPVLGENYTWEHARGISKLLLLIEKQFFLRNDRVYTNAQYLADMLKQHLHLDNPRVRLIYNGIDTAFLKKENFANIKRDIGIERMIYVGVRFVKYKALDVLIKAARPILDELDAYLVIGGNGPEEQALKQLAAGHPRIKFLGNLSWEKNIEYVRSADVYALPTLVDKTPNCIMEALSLERPCITTDIDGVKELIPAGGGLLIQPNDISGLQNKIRWVFDHPDEARAMGQRARQYMVQEFDWKLTCQRIEGIYQELLSA